MNIPNSIIIDFECMGTRSSSIVLDLSAVVFREDQVDSFDKLIKDTKRLFHVKFDVKSQVKTRTVDSVTLDWWNKQNDDVRSVLNPSIEDKTIEEGIELFSQFCELNDIDPKNSLAYSRGTSYDFPILADIVSSVKKEVEPGMWPCAFWNQRDVRSAIAYAMLQPHLRKLPVVKDTFLGFVKHNSIHDVCKDAILLQTALAYGRGDLEMPDIVFDGSVDMIG